MTPHSLPSSEELTAYDPQLDAEDAALSSGNTRLGIIVGALFALGVLSYALAPNANGSGSNLAAVTPSFLLEGASVTGHREAEAPATTAPAATAASEASPDEDESVATKPTALAKAAARPATATPAGIATIAAPSLTPLAASELVAVPAAVAPAPEPVRASPTTLTLSGRILNEEGKPLVGATVLLKGSSKGTSTDGNGHYELDAPAGDNSLIFGYGGYGDEEMHTRGAQSLNVTLTPTPGAKRRHK